jgi:hypothetical protein
MKRIIRLTESDLARIVRRVIKEQVEATTMAAETYYKVPAIAGNTLSMTRGGKDVMWTVTPSQLKTKDDRGNVVPVPGNLRLTVSAKDLTNTFVNLTIDCKLKTVKSTSMANSGNYTQVVMSANGREWKGDDVTNGLKQAFQLGTNWKYQGAIKDMGDKYCSAV